MTKLQTLKKFVTFLLQTFERCFIKLYTLLLKKNYDLSETF